MPNANTHTSTEIHDWHALAVEKACSFLETDGSLGISSGEAARRREIFGENRLPEREQASPFAIFVSQFTSPLILILLGASVVTLLLHDITDTIVILIALLLNAGIGFAQEYKATSALSKLNHILQTHAGVVRGGREMRVLQEDLVPGDLIVLRAGFKVPADGRLLRAEGLQINEAQLTGEWIASRKREGVLERETPLADRDNMVYMGSMIQEGEGIAVVTATGSATEIGRVASLVRNVREERTPYQARLLRLSWVIGGVVAAIALFILLEGLIRGNPFAEMFAVAVAVAVAAVPEGLPIAITVILALGTQRILRERGLVRRLGSAETLGSASVIATDKTLTLTTGTMRAAEILPVYPAGRGALLRAAVFANEAFLEEEEGEKVVRGRPTDRALFEMARNEGADPAQLLSSYPLIKRIPFDGERKYIVSFHQENKGVAAYLAGAPERLLAVSSLSAQEKKEQSARINALAEQGFRVVGLACKEDAEHDMREGSEVRGAEFLGIVGIHDPLREGVREAVQAAMRAGVRTVMVTGDHVLTARAVARKLGLPAEESNVIEGEDLEHLSDRELEDRLPSVFVFARVAPEHKLRIVGAWQRRGAVIAMTGDGVNDAPALKKADIGVALESGTDVAKEVADLVLLDDTFAVIPAAIRQGRIIVENIRRAVTFMLTGNFTETVLVAFALVLGLPLPITASQILWANLVQGSLPGVALSMEGEENGVMDRPPLPKRVPLLDGLMKTIIFAVGLFTDIVALALFVWLLREGYAVEHARTIMFSIISVDSLMYVFSCRSLRKNIWEYRLFSNRLLTAGVAAGFALFLLAVYHPLFQGLFGTVGIGAFEWGIVLGFGLLNVLLIEAVKWYGKSNFRLTAAA